MLVCGILGITMIVPAFLMNAGLTSPASADMRRRESGKPAQQQTPPPKKTPPREPLDMIKLEASYDEHLLPIFEEQCAECHDAGEAELELNLMEFTTFLKGSIDGPVIEPGKSDKSKLFEVVQEGSEPHMPPDEQLSEDDLATIKKWIDELPSSLKKKLGKRTDDGLPSQ